MAITKRDIPPRARISYDEMEAFLVLPTPKMGEEYTFEEVMEFLDVNQIRHGIEQELIRKMIRDEVYNREFCVAVGTPMVEGRDGHYDYLFNHNFSKKPKIRPDGSVDYWSINTIEPVEKGQVIVIYKPARAGEDGMTVKGKPILAKRARDLPPLKGRGFTRQEDGVTYTANMDGKVDMEGERVIVSPLYEIFGNADLSVGNINFVGDVLIHGNVASGVTIKATGNITVDGVVESAYITANSDIILRSGMVGGNRARLNCGGNLYAKFVEYTKIEVKGRIEADAFVGCEIVCGEQILLNGKKSKIVGGEVYAVQGIQASVLGSPGEVQTLVQVGAREEVVRRISLIERKVEVMEANLDKIEEGLKNFDKLGKERGVDYRDDPRRVELLRIKIQDMAAIAADRNELERLNQELEDAKGATIAVRRIVFPGVSVGVDDLKLNVLEEQEKLQFEKRIDKIVMTRLEEEDV